MREYTIKLSKEDVDLIIHDIQFSINNDQGNEISNSDRGDVITNLMVTKEKPYTNFDEFRDSLSVEKMNFNDNFKEACMAEAGFDGRYKDWTEWLRNEVKK